MGDFSVPSTGSGPRTIVPAWDTPPLRRHARRLLESHRRWTGRDLLPLSSDDGENAARLAKVPFVVVSHGPEADPVLDYGNDAALALWEMPWGDFVRTPSRFTAEAPDRAERARLLDQVTRHGFIADDTGIRVTRTGRRFQIAQATVWNLVGDDGAVVGQAATFDRWGFL